MQDAEGQVQRKVVGAKDRRRDTVRDLCLVLVLARGSQGPDVNPSGVCLVAHFVGGARYFSLLRPVPSSTVVPTACLLPPLQKLFHWAYLFLHSLLRVYVSGTPSSHDSCDLLVVPRPGPPSPRSTPFAPSLLFDSRARSGSPGVLDPASESETTTYPPTGAFLATFLRRDGKINVSSSPSSPSSPGPSPAAEEGVRPP